MLPLCVGVPAAGTYSFSAAALANLPAGLDAWLSDAATGQTLNLRTQPRYSFSVSPTEAAALINGRFTIRFALTRPLATATTLTATDVSLYPNPATTAFTVTVPAVAGAAQVQATLFNALGQAVLQRQVSLPASGARFDVPTTNLATGVYMLRLLVGGTTLVKRVVLQ